MKCKILAVTLMLGGFSPLALSAPMDISLKNEKGEEVGTAKLTALANGVRINLEVKNLPPGEKAFHFHEKASCVGPKFESAGSHFAPDKKKHGFDVGGGFHAGDMPNIMVSEQGTAKLEIVNTHVRLGKGKNSLLKPGGTALVIHAKADDYKSQPAGDAGDRIACGEIKELVTQ